MKELTDKEIISFLNSLVHSGDLRLKVSIKDDMLETIATSTLTYKNRKITNSKYSKSKDV